MRVSSPTSRDKDRTERRESYENLAVREYFLYDPGYGGSRPRGPLSPQTSRLGPGLVQICKPQPLRTLVEDRQGILAFQAETEELVLEIIDGLTRVT